MFHVAIDIGHARETGAVGLLGVNEHTIAARVAHCLRDKLAGYSCVRADVIDYEHMTNSADLAATIEYVNAHDFDALVSLHCDASDNPSAHGAHVCYTSAAGQNLAEEIAANLCQLLPGRASSTVRRPELAILRRTRPVAVLVEMGFITNKQDAEIQRCYPEEIAHRIMQGLLSYMWNQ